MAAMMLTGMLMMALAAWFYSIAIALTRVRAIILERERHAGWAGEVALRSQGRAMSVAEFLAMGGYGFYVWGSYAACALAIAAEIVAVRARLARGAARAPAAGSRSQ